MEKCRTFWGTHGCSLPRGHEGDCVCNPACATAAGKRPYYGAGTFFFGKDAIFSGRRTTWGRRKF